MTGETETAGKEQQESDATQMVAKEVTFTDVEPETQEEHESQGMDFLLDIPLEIEFVQLSSYGTGRAESSGEVRVVHDLGTPVEGRHVLVVEDIVDTGLSLRFLLDRLEGRNPSSLKLCSLLDKPSRRRAEISIDYLGFEVPDVFVVGYGIDFDERFRYLSDICAVEWNDVS